MLKRYRSLLFQIPLLGTLMLSSLAAQAVPAFARQTGQNCVACHVSFPELTAYGRMFKLNGYTFGQRQTVPLAIMAIASSTRIENAQGNGIAYPHDGHVDIESGSLFLAGKVTDHIGAFSQWTYNNLNPVVQGNGSTHFGGQTTIDNNDWRIADRITSDERDLIYGLSLNNNPTVQDVWNGTPGFGYPYQTSRLASIWGVGAPATLIEGALAQQSAGLSAYAFLNKHWYGELGTYRAADGGFRLLSHAVDIGNRLYGNTNPYWRFAYSQDWGSNSAEIGLFGLDARIQLDPKNASGGKNRYHDIGIDAQYQHLLDPHVFTAQLSFIHEITDWDSSLIGSSYANSRSTLNSAHVKGSYWYNRKYGATLSYFNEHGSSDYLAYPQTGTPNTYGYIAELNYMIDQNWRLGLQYTDYQRYDGASSNYDGNGRNAHDNDITYLYTWFAF